MAESPNCQSHDSGELYLWGETQVQKEKGRQGKNEKDFPGFATDTKKINTSTYNNFNQSMTSQSTETG